MKKDKGDIYLSKKIKERVSADSGYFMELYSIMDDMSRSQKIEPISHNHPDEKDKKNHVIVQYPTSSGRVYIETVIKKRYSPVLFLKIPYYYTNIYIYSAMEYEYHREETDMYSIKKLNESED